MGLRLITGPANCGKTGLVLDAFLEALSAGAMPWLLAPTYPDAARLERELVQRRGALVGARAGTLDSIVREVLRRAGAEPERWVGAVEKRILLEACAREAALDALAPSAATAGFADALGIFIDGLGQALVDPGALLAAVGADAAFGPVAREAAALYAAYRARLDEEGSLDAVTAAGRAARLLTEGAPWTCEPCFAVGYDDLPAGELALVRALASRGPVTMSVAFAPGRAAFEGVAAVAGALEAMAEDVTPVTAEPGRYRSELLGHLEAGLFEPDVTPIRRDATTLGALSAAGPRAEAELAASEVLARLAAGVPADQVAVLARSLGPYAALIGQVFRGAAIPYDMEETRALGQVPLGRSLVALARFAVGGELAELVRVLLSPHGGLAPAAAARFDAQLRRRGVTDGGHAAKMLSAKARDGEIEAPPDAPVLRWATEQVPGDAFALMRLVEEAAPAMLVAAHGRDAPELSDDALADAAAVSAAREVVAELRRIAHAGATLRPSDVLAALERAEVRTGGEARPGCVQVLPALRARGRRFDTVVLIGLNERAFPRTPADDPFITDDERAALAARGIVVPPPTDIAWERYLFYTAVTRARHRLVLGWQASDAAGRPLTRSFFVDDAEGLFEGPVAGPGGRPGGAAGALRDVTTHKGLASPVFGEASSAPGKQELRRALAARLASVAGRPRRGDLSTIAARGPEWLASAAHSAVGPRPGLSGAAAEALAGRTLFSATSLESYARCPVRWFVEHELSPEPVERRLGPLERGSLIHSVLASLGADIADTRFGTDEGFTEEVAARARTLLSDAIAEAAGAMEGLEVQLAARLAERQLRTFMVMQGRRDSRFVPEAFELAFGGEDTPGPLRLAEYVLVRGRIDRVDVDPSGRAFVIDYKTGKRAPDEKAIQKAENLQVRLYCVAWDRLFAGRAVGGGYWVLGSAAVGGICDKDAVDPSELGLADGSGLEHEAWDETLAAACEAAVDIAQAIRSGRIEPTSARKGPEGCWGCDHSGWCGLWT
jgi:RecB family exonuclease/superfamily I DNA/RNA helicase